MVNRVIESPHSYAEWVFVLDMLKNKVDDDEILKAMQTGTIEWQSGVAERFSKKLIEAVNYRLNSATDKFQKEMLRSCGQERTIVQNLLALRKELCFLVKAIDLPTLPERERRQYCGLVIDQANDIQNSLENSAKADRSGKLMSIVQNNKVNILGFE